MFRYMVLQWDEGNSRSAEGAQALGKRIQSRTPDLREIYGARGLRVFCAGDQGRAMVCRALPGGRGVILGSLFKAHEEGDTSAARSHVTINATESEWIIGSAGLRLVERYWGSYIAVLHDSRAEKTWILRSPVGHLPCLCTAFEDVHIYFSFTPDCASLDLLPFTLNWQYLAGYLLKSIHTGETGLNEVSELQCGHRVEFQRGRLCIRSCWDLDAVAGLPPIEGTDQAIRAIRRVTKSCVRAWASCHDSVLHYLSGGLDSAIVLGCLYDAPDRPDMTCLNHYSDGSNSDERNYARLAAQQASVALTERRREADVQLDAALQLEALERPQNYSRQLGAQPFEAELMRSTGATAIFSGNRGDEVFMRNAPELAAADYLRRHGFGPDLVAAIMNASRIKGYSVWKVAKEAFVQGLTSRPSPASQVARQHHTLINEEAVLELRGSEPSALGLPRSASRVPPGKRLQLSTLSYPESYYSSFGRRHAPEYVAPLMSQPLLELCARIPTYVLTYGGWDRAAARGAFVGDVPVEILRRRSKGGMEEHVGVVFNRNIQFIRDTLLNGALVREGLLNRQKLEEALSGRPSGVMQGMVRIFQYLDVEIWIALWGKTSGRIAA